ncbi:MAG: ATP synthase F1 subunit epsilon [Acidimicrobiales bacterium]
MATPFHVEIVTPERTVYSGEADEVSMRTDAGEIAFLAHHEDFIGAADVTVVRVTTPGGGDGTEHGGEVRLAVHGGFVHVDQDENSVRILAGVAELASEIDVERARRALEAAEASEVAATPPPAAASGHDAETGPVVVPPVGSLLAMLEPDAPEAAAKRARVRLDAAGAAAPT